MHKPKKSNSKSHDFREISGIQVTVPEGPTCTVHAKQMSLYVDPVEYGLVFQHALTCKNFSLTLCFKGRT